MKMRTITEVVEYKTENIISSDEFFANDIDVIFKQRYELEKAYQLNMKLWVCPLCRQPVKIRGKRDGIKAMHFAHIADKLDCPIKTGKNYTKNQILRMKYNGQKESPTHFKLKNIIARSITKDKRFSDVKVDKRLTGICKDWRKPDVSAVFKGQKVVFELQLSTTFLNVIAERNLFYQNNGIYIIWIFDNNRKNVENMRFMEKDIFYPNNHNAFFISEETNSNNFKLICGYEKPVIAACSFEKIWQLNEVDFGDLTFREDYQVFWFDYENEKKKIQKEIEKIEISEFGSIWIRLRDRQDKLNLIKKYDDLFQNFGVDVNPLEILSLLDCLYSIKYKKVIGHNFQKIVQVLHLYFQSELYRDQHFGELIFKAIRAFGARDVILKEDRTRKFYDRAKAYKKSKYIVSRKYDPILKILFPEIWEIYNTT